LSIIIDVKTYKEMFMSMRALDTIALLLVIIGAINWGLIGFFQFDLVASLFGGMTSMLSRTIYALVGIAGLYAISFLAKDRDRDTREVK
jgi:uncharacterized protein